MIFNSNKPVGDIPPDRAGPDGDPWDETTLSWLGKTSMLDLRVTHTERRFKGGPGAPWGHIQSGNPEVNILARYDRSGENPVQPATLQSSG